LEEELANALDRFLGTRDLSWVWHEILHVLFDRIRNWFGHKGPLLFNFYDAGRPVLGSRNSGDVRASTELNLTDIPISLFNVFTDPFETQDLANDPLHKDSLNTIISAFNKHWQHRMPSFDWQTSCPPNIHRLHLLPDATCSRRTSHLSESLDQRSVSANIPCAFEVPFIEDDDPNICGMSGGSPINVKHFFVANIVRMIQRLVTAAFILAILFIIGVYQYLKSTPSNWGLRFRSFCFSE
jgi:hypothetical protein